MTIKVLVVLDGIFGFTAPLSATDPDFTYTTLIGALAGAGMQVTTAHRGADPTASLPGFHFNAAANLLQYDVIWLIGHQGRNMIGPMAGSPSSNPGLPDDELREIARFMAAGGGVFATGDHDSVGSEMGGHIPRVRAMRSWYGDFDTASPMPGTFPRNFPVTTAGRADTTQRNPGGDYNGDTTFVWFENQSDHIPQPITPVTSPAHPILRRNGADITVYPDHMHEGQTLGELPSGYSYTQSIAFLGETFDEFPMVAGHRETPKVIATGQTTGLASRHTADGAFVGSDGALSTMKTVNTLSVYEGRVAGVGRIVTGSTFHHYVDINLTGDSSVDAAQNLKTGPDSRKGHGFSDPVAADTFASIQAVYVNITQWLARPRPAISIILERSTFSQAEAMAAPNHAGALLVTVDGLKPSQFPGGPINTLSPGAAALANWAPAITFEDATGITLTPTGVSSDDPTLAERVQRFTFTYEVDVGNAAFGFVPSTRTLHVDASLAASGVAAPLTDRAWIELVKAANPYMLDLANGNVTAWLSSDVRVFPVVADGNSHHGQTLPANATRSQALHFLKGVVDNMTIGAFEALEHDETGSALSPLSTTTDGTKKVYNFAIARVRLNNAAAASDVRVAFRIVPSPTTASLTYHESMGQPTGSYMQTNAADPIAVPGRNAASTEWLSFPCFAQDRTFPPASQLDDNNRKPMGPAGAEVSVFYGALIDNNLLDTYLPPSPAGGAPISLPMLMMGEHQCLVAQVLAAGVPIPDGAQPATSDKLAQRNLAFSPIANPGLDASRMAVHTFEIEAATHPIGEKLPPDELLLDWRGAPPPEGTEVRIYIPTWGAQAVVELADRFYPRHEIRAVDPHTVAVPGGGMRYVPVPPTPLRQTGVISAEFPIGVKGGERFDLAVRQISNRGRTVDPGQPKAQTISREEAARLIAGLKRRTAARQAEKGGVERGVFDLGNNRVLVTDLRVLDQGGDHAVVIEHVDPKRVAAARRQSGVWRETIGAFQLGVPVSMKGEMLHYHARLLSALRWRAEHLRPNGRWYASFRRYVELMAEKVAALGGDPYCVPPHPDGDVPPPRDRCGRTGDQKG